MKKLLVLLLFFVTLTGCVLPLPTVPTNPTDPTESKTEVLEKEQLATPNIKVDQSGLASFAVKNATSYIYVLNDGEAVTTESSTLQLNKGDTLKVKAVGDDINFTDSNWSQLVTCKVEYNPGTNPDLNDGYTEFPWI